MQMIQIFGAWIGATRLSSLDINAALDYVQTIDNDIGGNGATTVTQRLLDVPVFNSVKKEIEILTKEYVVNQGHIVDEVKISSSWGNTLTKGQPISMHQHPNSYVSGVLYLTEGAPLHFHNPLQTEDLFTFRPNVQWDALKSRTRQYVPISI